MIPPKNHAFFRSQTFTRHCNFRTSLLLLIASGALTGSCCSRAESSAAWALHHRHHYHHLPTVHASASTFVTYSSDIHHIFISQIFINSFCVVKVSSKFPICLQNSRSALLVPAVEAAASPAAFHSPMLQSSCFRS